MNQQKLQALYNDWPVKYVHDEGGLSYLDIRTPLAEARIYRQGAQITRFCPAGEKEVLFTSARSWFQPGKAIRGGVPICFPWFGPKADDPAAPIHGFVRLMDWRIENITSSPDGSIVVVMALEHNPANWAIGQQSFNLQYRIVIGRQLHLELTLRNNALTPLITSHALHSYFAIGDIHQTLIRGLSGVEYLDKTQQMQRFTQDEQPISITGETDRVYVNTKSDVVIEDQASKRRIRVKKSGSHSTVVWNPWIEKSAKMQDFGDDEWQGMVCVETANAFENILHLPPGEQHTIGTTISFERF